LPANLAARLNAQFVFSAKTQIFKEKLKKWLKNSLSWLERITIIFSSKINIIILYTVYRMQKKIAKICAKIVNKKTFIDILKEV